jgi:hypothetical protein
MSRRQPGRATRQILSGSELAPPRDTIAGNPPSNPAVSFTYRYFLGLSALVILAALVGVFWGPGPASAILLILAIGLIGSWLVV